MTATEDQPGSKTTARRPKKPPKKPRPVGPELKFQAEVLALCEGRDLWPVLVNPSRFTQRAAANRGFPDLLIAGPGGVIFRELKIQLSQGRGLSPAQVTWRDRLKCSGQNWATWLPEDLTSGRIERELAEIETPGADGDRFALAMLGIPGTGSDAPEDSAPAARPELGFAHGVATGAGIAGLIFGGAVAIAKRGA